NNDAFFDQCATRLLNVCACLLSFRLDPLSPHSSSYRMPCRKAGDSGRRGWRRAENLISFVETLERIWISYYVAYDSSVGLCNFLSEHPFGLFIALLRWVP